MNFRTEISCPAGDFKINHRDNIVTIGSCFAENIGSYFSDFRFSVLKNPFGVLYNPVSILNSLKIVESGEKCDEQDLIFDQSEYHSFYFHSDFSSHDKEECLANINSSLSDTNEFLKKTNVLIVTLGTSFIYRHLEKDIVVSNCHKIPQKHFETRMLTQEETRNALQEIVNVLRRMKQDIKVIFTVSPVRHWKNGAIQNQLSKSNLIVAVHEVISQNKNTFYFPSYEIMMDDLRDYRFYDADLLHPNKMGTDYIWEKFIASYFTDETQKLIERISKIQKAATHRPRNINSSKHREFLKEQIKKLRSLEEEYPYLNLSDLHEYFSAKIK